MCAVSVIYNTLIPLPDSWYNLERIKFVQQLIVDAKKFDTETNQQDCQDEDKSKIEDHLKDLEEKLYG